MILNALKEYSVGHIVPGLYQLIKQKLLLQRELEVQHLNMRFN
jgi:hypothetical protein